jgi:hypothetical protein
MQSGLFSLFSPLPGTRPETVPFHDNQSYGVLSARGQLDIIIEK